MTAMEYRKVKKLVIFMPLITAVCFVLISYGSWQASSSNIQRQFDTQKAECDKRFEKIEREKADAALVESKFDNIDWKLDLIMSSLKVPYTKPPNRDTL